MQFNDYKTPVVPVCKALQPGQQKAKLRVSGDYSVKVNAQLEITHHHPYPDDLIRKLGGGYFTKIDLSNAYSQIKLAPESQKRLALSTQRRPATNSVAIWNKFSTRLFQRNNGKADQ